MRAREIYEYNKLTWPEMNDAIEMQKVVILPTGSTEQHGPHMPLDVDLFLVREVCHELGRRAPDKVLVLPAIPCGLNLHHIDFPGTIHIEPEVFIAFCLITVLVAVNQRWSVREAGLGLLSAVPPFLTVWFERRMERRARLDGGCASATSCV